MLVESYSHVKWEFVIRLVLPNGKISHIKVDKNNKHAMISIPGGRGGGCEAGWVTISHFTLS